MSQGDRTAAWRTLLAAARAQRVAGATGVATYSAAFSIANGITGPLQANTISAGDVTALQGAMTNISIGEQAVADALEAVLAAVDASNVGLRSE